MPTWWLVLSGIFFLLSILILLVLAVLLLRLQKILQTIQPSILGSVAKLESATEKLQATANDARKTVEHVGLRARNVADGIEAVALVSAQRLQLLTTILTTTSTVWKLFQMVKSNKADKVKVDKKALNRDNSASHRGVEQPGSSSGS